MSILSILWQSVTITLFVLSMMLIIEYLNVFSKGLWSEKIRKRPFSQILIGALLGIIPGCLGAYTAVSLYVHNIIGKGALVAAMIATSGDEAFFMFSIIPKTAIIIHVSLFVLAIIAGLIVNSFAKKKHIAHPVKHFEIHENETLSGSFFTRTQAVNQLKKPSLFRLGLIIAFLLAVFLVLINFGHLLEGFGSIDPGHESHHHLHPEWISVTFLVVLIISLIIVAVSNDHFLEEHLRNHIIKKHLLRIFLWTFFTLLAIQLASHYLDIENLIGDNLVIVLIIAVLVGIIPESGPHFVFILLFASGNLPFSILLANSIVQDGHGSLPLLAENQKDFIIVKAINVVAGLLIGIIGLMAGI